MCRPSIGRKLHVARPPSHKRHFNTNQLFTVGDCSCKQLFFNHLRKAGSGNKIALIEQKHPRKKNLRASRVKYCVSVFNKRSETNCFYVDLALWSECKWISTLRCLKKRILQKNFLLIIGVQLTEHDLLHILVGSYVLFKLDLSQRCYFSISI